MYTLYAPQEPPIIARLTLTYEDHSGRKYWRICAYTDQNHWRQVKFLPGIRKDLKAFNDAIRSTSIKDRKGLDDAIRPPSTIEPTHSNTHRIDWGDAPNILMFRQK